jgi:hypothetical protein
MKAIFEYFLLHNILSQKSDFLHLFTFKSPALRAETNEEGDVDFALVCTTLS